MLAESCRSRMIGILAAVWRFLPPYSGAVHLPRFNCFPILASFTLSSYNLTNISKFMRFLPNITCVRDLPPSRRAPQLHPASMAHEVALYMLASGDRGFLLSIFSFLLSPPSPFLIFIHSFASAISIFLRFNRRKVELCLACT